jgi:nucleotide-binding universal stress UspA family protein
MKILLACDGSPTAAAATRRLIEHLGAFREPPELHLLFVHPPVPIALARQHVARELLDRYYREEGEAALKAAQESLDSAGLRYTSHIHVGDPAPTIVRLAGELGCGLICIGTHGRAAVADAIVGSVAHKVLHLARMPVLLAR